MVNLTIGGGSYKGIAFIGALHYLYSKNYLEVIENFYGCSIGTIIGTLFIIGYKPYDIFEIILKLNLDEFWDISINNIDKKYSLVSDKIFQTVEEYFIKKESNKNITIKEFNNKYSIYVNLFSININKNKIVNFNQENFSNLSILTAIKASCSIPIIFSPVLIDDDYYVDGCFKCLNGIFHDNINDKNNINLGYIIRLNYIDDNKIDNFNAYINKLLKCLIFDQDKLIYTKNTIEITLKDKYRNKMSFNNINNSVKIELFYEGLIQAIDQLD